MVWLGVRLAFEWVLKSHIYVPDPELERTRTAVTQLCARLLGAMTPKRLGLISDNFLKVMLILRINTERRAGRDNISIAK
eukprot:scaffold46222_cov23-Prasinocladus_malaysianus.AAC.1